MDDNRISAAGALDIVGSDGDDSIYLDAESFPETVPFVERTIDGGAGNDTVYLSIVEPAVGPRSRIDLLAQRITFSDPAWGTQFLISIENAWGSDAYDTIIGTNAANFLDGGFGGDTLYGGGGNDALYGGISGNDLIYGGDGDDLVDGGWDIYSINDTDTLYGGGGNDVLVGNKFDDMLDGGSGDDILYGGPRDEATGAPSEDDLDFDDTLFGGAGADRLYGGWGDDVMTGGSETDTFFGGSGSDTVLYTGITTDMRVDLALGRATLPGTTSLSESLASIENAETGAGDDVLVGDGGGNRLVGGLGHDALTGGAGDDELYGGEGADSFDGGAGADRLYGGGGDDNLLGGTEVDFMDGGAGVDTVRISGTAAARIDLALGRLSFPTTAGAETVVAIENASGAAGADVLIGAAGANVLRGAGGADRLTGGGSADVLVGGAQNDVFVFLAATDSRKAAADRIVAGDGATAFENAGAAAGDRIDLSAIDAVSGGVDQAFKFGAATGAGRLWLVEIGTNTHVRGNLDSSAAYEFELIIEDGALRAAAYAAADFVL